MEGADIHPKQEEVANMSDTNNPKLKTILVKRIDPDELHKARVQAVKNRTNLSELIRAFLRAYGQGKTQEE